MLDNPMSASMLRQIQGTPSGPRAARSVLGEQKASYFAEQEGSREIVTVKESATVEKAFELLSEQKILSLPVKDSGRKRGYKAFVDMLDVLTHFSTVYADEFKAGARSESPAAAAEKRQRFLNAKVGDICNLSGRDQWFPIQEDAPLRSVVDLFAVHGVHRVPIVDASGELLTVISQSRIVHYLADHSDRLAEHFPKESLQVLGLGIKAVVSIKTSDPALNAFVAIRAHSVSGVAVLDEAGKLVGNISVSDLRMIRSAESYLDVLLLSAEAFLREVAISRGVSKPSIPDGPLTIAASSTLEEAFVKFSETAVHRLYIVSETGDLVGLLALGDALSALLV